MQNYLKSNANYQENTKSNKNQQIIIAEYSLFKETNECIISLF